MPHIIINAENAHPRCSSERASTEAPATTKSPASLLWAHQLRREHKALVSRADQLEGKIASSKEDAVAGITSVTTRLDDLETGLRDLREEISDLKSAMENLGKWREEREREQRENNEKERDKLIEWEGRLKGEFTEEIRGLGGIVEELRETIGKIDRSAPHLSALRGKYSTPQSAQPQLNKTNFLEIPSTVSGTPAATNINGDSQHSSPLVTQPCSSSSPRTSSVRGNGQASPILGSSPFIKDICHSLYATRPHGTGSLLHLQEKEESVRSKVLQRREDAPTRSAFWEAVPASQTRNSIKEKLCKEKSAQNGYGENVNGQASRTTAQNPDGRGVAGKKRKLLRRMPIEWNLRE